MFTRQGLFFEQSVNVKRRSIIVSICLLAMIGMGCGGGGGGGESNAAPAAQIILPADGSNINAGDDIIFAGSCLDKEDGSLSGVAMVWTSDLDGEIGTGETFVANTLSSGTHQVSLTGSDAKGETGAASVTVIVVPNAAPVAQITGPADGSSFEAGNDITFAGSSTDREEGDLTGVALVWTSDLDGEIGTGESFTSNTLSVGSHQITLTGTDAKGATGTAGVALTVNPGPPVKSWRHPVDLTDNISPDDVIGGSPQVAMNGAGDAIVVCEGWDGAYRHIYMSEYRNNVWTHPVDMTDYISPQGQSAFDPRVAMDDAGNVVVIWEQSDGANSQIYVSEYRNNTWTHPGDLTDNISLAGQDAVVPQVAMDNAGNTVVVWEQSDGANSQIFMSEYRNDVWTLPADLSDNISPDGQGAVDSQVGMDNAGNAVVVWSQDDGASSQIFMSEYRNDAWAHPTDLSDNISPDGQGAGGQQVAMDGAGNAMVVWVQSDVTNSQIFMSEYRNNAWTHPADLSDNISPDGGSPGYPQVAINGAGDAVVTWNQYDSTIPDYRNTQIFMSEYHNGAWTHPLDLADNISPDNQNAWQPRVAMDGAGNTIVVWRQYFGINGQVFLSEYRDDAWAHPIDLSDYINPVGSAARGQNVAMNDSGNAILVWTQSDGLNDQIFISEYR